jgi:predicted PurR-regulated permease PerM
MKFFDFKSKSPQTKNRIVIAMAVFCTILVVMVWLFVLSITKPKTQKEPLKPFQEISEQVSGVIQESSLEKISETNTELKNNLETVQNTQTTQAESPLSSTP